MSAIDACPEPDVVRRFALGWLSEEQSRGLEEHLAACPSCSRLLHATEPEGDELIQALRDQPTQPSISSEVIDALLPILRALRPPGDTQAFPGRAALDAECTACTSPGSLDPGEVSVPFGFLDPPAVPGDLGELGGYRIKRILGAGGMGIVLLAEDPRLHRDVAVKVIQPHLASEADSRHRFLREARAIAAIEHDNIVAIHRADEHNGVLYLAMPLLRGESLERRLHRVKGPLPLPEVLQIGRETASALAAAHAHGILHRDVKPGNIWLEALPAVGPPGTHNSNVVQAFQPDSSIRQAGKPELQTGAFRVKLLDFGLAYRPGGEGDDRREGKAIVGTPAYMAPEQALGEEIDARADLFALGCVVYRAAAGKPPFSGKDLLAVLVSIASDPPPPLEGVPRDLVRLILRLLAKKPAQRPASAEAVALAFEAMQRKRAGASRRRWLIAAALGVAGAAGGLAWRLALPTPAEPPAPGRVTFVLDEPNPRIILTPDEGEERTMDLAREGEVELPPGGYALRMAGKDEKRILVPARLTVKPGEDKRLPLRLVGEVAQLAEHTRAVWSVALSPVKGSLLALSGGGDRTVAVWDAAQANRPTFLTGHTGSIRCVAFSADGRLAVSGSGDRGQPGRKADCSVRLWDLQKAREINRPVVHGNWIVGVRLSPDGWLLGWCSVDGTASLWDRRRNVKHLDLLGHDARGVNSIAFAPDSRRVLTAGGDGLVLLWEVEKGGRQATLAGHKGEVFAVAFRPGAKQAASGGEDGTVRFWDLEKNSARRVLKGHRGAVHGVAWTPDGRRLLSAGSDGTVRVWSADGDEIYVLKGHVGPVYSVDCSADGRRALSGGADRTVRLWELPA